MTKGSSYTLSTRLLKIIHKGVRTIENIRFLRDCRSLGIRVLWNFLYFIPGEKDKDYFDMFDMFPLLTHLNPPGKVIPLIIQRFSPLFHNYRNYGITELKPLAIYKYIYPEQADIIKLAIYFDGENVIGIDNTIQRELKKNLKTWQDNWASGTPPDLRLTRLPGNQYMLIDSRGINKATYHKLDVQYIDILSSLQNPVNVNSITQTYAFSQLLSWKCIMRIENEYISLVTNSGS